MNIKPPKKGEKIVVGMSGGIDSSVALILLKQAGWEPIGVSLNISNTADAKKVCIKLHCKHTTLKVKKEFADKVVTHFLKEYKNARTPNPCVFCNRNFKFQKLFDYAKDNNIEYVATGHYADIKKGFLSIPADKKKDQTYNLCFLKKQWLPKIVFPLNDLLKEEAYAIAKKNNLKFLETKKQSQDFCYLGDKKVSDFLLKELGKKKGRIVDEKGKEVGVHSGLHFYTIGQRKGIGLAGGPWYVKGKDVKKNELIVAKEIKTIKRVLILKPCNFFVKVTKPINAKVKTRYAQKPLNATIKPFGSNIAVLVSGPENFALGQYCVAYKGDICIGGGKIKAIKGQGGGK